VDSAVSHLESAGEFIKDGAVELIRTVDEAGTAAYYVAGEMVESLRNWLFDNASGSAIVSSVTSLPFTSDATVYPAFTECYSKCLTYPYHFLAYQGGSINRWICGYSSSSGNGSSCTGSGCISSERGAVDQDAADQQEANQAAEKPGMQDPRHRNHHPRKPNFFHRFPTAPTHRINI